MAGWPASPSSSSIKLSRTRGFERPFCPVEDRVWIASCSLDRLSLEGPDDDTSDADPPREVDKPELGRRPPSFRPLSLFLAALLVGCDICPLPLLIPLVTVSPLAVPLLVLGKRFPPFRLSPVAPGSPVAALVLLRDRPTTAPPLLPGLVSVSPLRWGLRSRLARRLLASRLGLREPLPVWPSATSPSPLFLSRRKAFPLSTEFEVPR